jgi:hypothetical protein
MLELKGDKRTFDRMVAKAQALATGRVSKALMPRIAGGEVKRLAAQLEELADRADGQRLAEDEGRSRAAVAVSGQHQGHGLQREDRDQGDRAEVPRRPALWVASVSSCSAA